MPNRLQDETSPYLLQHADNPVDWYPWGDEALERAKAEDRPILLSIGYSACHWCHVMAHESFEDTSLGSRGWYDGAPVIVEDPSAPDGSHVIHWHWSQAGAISPDGGTLVVENNKRLVLTERAVPDSNQADPVDIGRAGRSVAFADL